MQNETLTEEATPATDVYTADTFDPKPGDHYPDLPNEVYHAGPGISASMLAEWADETICPAYWKQRQANPKPATDAMEFGTAVHRLALEEELFEKHYAVVPKGKKRDARTAWYQAFCAEHEGKVHLTQKDADDIRNVAEKLRENSFFRDLIGPQPLIENSFYAQDPDTGLLLKTRPDSFAGLEADVKTTADSSPVAFGRQVINLHYGLKAAFHQQVLEWCLGERPQGFVWIVIDRTNLIPEFYPLDEARLALGTAAWRKALNELAACMESGEYPTFTQDRLQPLPLSAREARQLENLKPGRVA